MLTFLHVFWLSARLQKYIKSYKRNWYICCDWRNLRTQPSSRVCVCVSQCVCQCVTSAGDVDGPLHVLLPEHNSCCSGFSLCVFLHFPLQSRRWRDKVALLSPDWQEKWDMMLSFQRPFNFLKKKQNTI